MSEKCEPDVYTLTNVYIYSYVCIWLLYFLLINLCSVFLYTVYEVGVFFIRQQHITFLNLHYHKTEGTVRRVLWSIQPLHKYDP